MGAQKAYTAHCSTTRHGGMQGEQHSLPRKPCVSARRNTQAFDVPAAMASAAELCMVVKWKRTLPDQGLKAAHDNQE